MFSMKLTCISFYINLFVYTYIFFLAIASAFLIILNLVVWLNISFKQYAIQAGFFSVLLNITLRK